MTHSVGYLCVRLLIAVGLVCAGCTRRNPDACCMSAEQCATLDVEDMIPCADGFTCGPEFMCVAEIPDAEMGVDAGPDAALPGDAEPDAFVELPFVTTWGSSAQDFAGRVIAAPTGYWLLGQVGGSDGTFGDEELPFGAYVAFVDTNGAPLSARSIVASGNTAVAGGVVGSSANLFLAGSLAGTLDLGTGALTSAGSWDGFVAKYGPDGTPAWSVRIGNASEERVTDIALDDSGDIYLSGYFSGSTNLGTGALASAGAVDGFVAKVRGSDGTTAWSFRVGGAATDYAYRITTVGTRVVVTGEFTGTAEFGGTALTSAGAADIFLAGYSTAAGAHAWSKRLGGNTNDRATNLVGDANAFYIADSFSSPLNLGGITHTSAGSSDIYAAKFDASTGSFAWSRTFGGTGAESPSSISIDGATVVLAGQFNSSLSFGMDDLDSAGSGDGFVAELAASTGDPTWAIRLGGTNNDEGQHAIRDGEWMVVLGTFGGVVYFGDVQETSRGNLDAFVWRFRR